MSSLGIKTPVAVAQASAEHEAAAAAAAKPAVGSPLPFGASKAGSKAPAATIIPMAAYVMPAPTWRVRPQFAQWEVDHTRFELKRLLGKGSYGSVAEAFDHLTQTRVAIKKVPNVFEVFENAKRIYREIRILRLLHHTNIIKVTHIQAPSDLLGFSDIYIVFECMDTDFAKLTRDDTQTITIPHVRWFLYQLLLSIKYTHSAGIIHRDIKPANILLTESCDLKLCDFGLARSMFEEADTEADEVRDMLGVAGREKGGAGVGAGGTDDPTPGSASADSDSSMAAAGAAASAGAGGALSAAGLPVASPATGPISRVMTKHVVTRWYRAPELPLYNDGVYTPAIDIWSVGCCYAEMLGMLDNGPESRFDRRALFPGGSCAPMSRERGAAGKEKSGKDKKDQLATIFEVLGTPTDEEMTRVRTEAAREFLATSVKARKPEDMMKRYPAATKEATDLLKWFLRFHPEDRITVDQALSHPFLAPVRRPHDELVRAEGPIHFRRVAPETIRDMFVEEVRAYNAQIPDNWKELAAAGLYEWRVLMESGGYDDVTGGGDYSSAGPEPGVTS